MTTTKFSQSIKQATKTASSENFSGSHFESASANPSMLCVNQKLGYKLNGLTEIRLVKYL